MPRSSLGKGGLEEIRRLKIEEIEPRKRLNQKEALPLDAMWPIILAELRSPQQLLRTTSAACALECVANQCLPLDENLGFRLVCTCSSS